MQEWSIVGWGRCSNDRDIKKDANSGISRVPRVRDRYGGGGEECGSYLKLG